MAKESCETGDHARLAITRNTVLRDVAINGQFGYSEGEIDNALSFVYKEKRPK